MNQLGLLILHLPFLLFYVQAQTTLADPNGTSQDAVSNFRPSLAVVIGILCIMFSLTFILLVYAKFCHRGASVDDSANRPALVRTGSRFSGIDKTVVESLPFFRFSSLKGSKEGLECAVCLSKFEDIEILRLLPKCKHAFHINCVDQWLEKHSSCPLCRCKVSAEDPTIFTYSHSMRYLGRNPSEVRDDDSNMELFVQREENRQGSSRFSIGRSFRKVDKGDKEEESILIQEQDNSTELDDQKIFSKVNHKIIVSDHVVLKNRWSSASSSDLMFLNSEMINDRSSNRFSMFDSTTGHFTAASRTAEDEQMMKIKEDMELKRLFETKISITNHNPSGSSVSGLPSTSDSNEISSHASIIINSTDRRSVSDITALSRFRNFNLKSTNKGYSSSSAQSNEEERQRQAWLPIARRTVQWLANRERRSPQIEGTKQTLDV
ncbi:hypothetical protein Tsubulata_003180 [Turnera subulata]|uniref:RING-type E3 ubiquitin transferase n=1 Tax=Turnera subulata TaxID=218843 RepID=A0A9Q0FY51_9ROSI|nr:hypothetical protein Tsubulata_003180 [Turnera subulata]